MLCFILTTEVSWDLLHIPFDPHKLPEAMNIELEPDFNVEQHEKCSLDGIAMFTVVQLNSYDNGIGDDDEVEKVAKESVETTHPVNRYF